MQSLEDVICPSFAGRAVALVVEEHVSLPVSPGPRANQSVWALLILLARPRARTCRRELESRAPADIMMPGKIPSLADDVAERHGRGQRTPFAPSQRARERVRA